MEGKYSTYCIIVIVMSILNEVVSIERKFKFLEFSTILNEILGLPIKKIKLIFSSQETKI